jgi:hypothetical protein
MEDLALTFPYTATDLTDQINVIPNRYGLMQELDLFPAEGSTSTIVEMRYENKTLRVLPAKERGAPSTSMLSETGKTIFGCGAESSIFRTSFSANIAAPRRSRPATRRRLPRHRSGRRPPAPPISSAP